MLSQADLKKKVNVDGTRQQVMKQRKNRETRTSTNLPILSKGPNAPAHILPFDQPVNSVPYNMNITNSNLRKKKDRYTKSNSNPMDGVQAPPSASFRFDQPVNQISYNMNNSNLRKRKNNTNNNINNNINNMNNNNNNAGQTKFLFKFGMEVGVALGDCFLQLQKLENCMDKSRNISEDIT
eukprot:275969_1